MSLGQHVTLLASLPDTGPLFAARQTPLSRLRLDERLRMLEPEERALLDRIEDVLQWERQPIERSDAELIRRARALLAELEGRPLHDLVLWRLDLRTVVAALRRRQRRDPPPSGGEPWGLGRFTDHIRRNWGERGFRLEGAFPWIPEAARLLEAGDALGLERLLLGVVWERLRREAGLHTFDFEAVVLYVLRWNVTARWTGQNVEAASRRFADLVEAGLGDSAHLFPEGAPDVG